MLPEAKFLLVIINVVPAEVYGLPLEWHPAQIFSALGGSEPELFFELFCSYEKLLIRGLNGLAVDGKFLGGAFCQRGKIFLIRVFSGLFPVHAHDLVREIPYVVDGSRHAFELLGGVTVFKSEFVG